MKKLVFLFLLGFGICSLGFTKNIVGDLPGLCIIRGVNVFRDDANGYYQNTGAAVTFRLVQYHPTTGAITYDKKYFISKNQPEMLAVFLAAYNKNLSITLSYDTDVQGPDGSYEVYGLYTGMYIN